MAEATPEPRDEQSNLTRRGLAARRARANMLKGSRQARADLDARWNALAREDPAAPRVPTTSPTMTETL